jgi:hypothetical protein
MHDEYLEFEYTDLIEPLKDIIKKITESKKYHILIDNTDNDWFNYPGLYSHFISNFIQSIYELNTEF